MLNYRHLYYFWVVAKEGGFARAADRLDMAVQTISAQVRELEKALGHQLLKPAGRGAGGPGRDLAPGEAAHRLRRLGRRRHPAGAGGLMRGAGAAGAH